MLLLFFSIFITANCNAIIDGTWCTAMNTNMTISTFGNNNIIGSYRMVDADGKFETSHIVGTYNVLSDRLIFTFYAHWNGAITTWVGDFYFDDKDWFCAEWIMVTDSRQRWNTFITNKDRYDKCDRPQPQPQPQPQ